MRYSSFRWCMHSRSTQSPTTRICRQSLESCSCGCRNYRESVRWDKPGSIEYGKNEDGVHCTENSKQIFPEMKLRGLVPNFDIHALWAIYIFTRSVCLFCCIAFDDQSLEYINRSQLHEWRNWKRGHAVYFWEYLLISGSFCFEFPVQCICNV
jgi:hypothetical protein